MNDPKKPRRQTLAGALATRAATAMPNEETKKKLVNTQELVAAAREARKQKLWDKIDTAKRRATDKHKRMESFTPPKAAGAPDADDDFEL
jgi:hypothetical protein